MNVVDSSGWLEFFADGPNGAFFAPPIVDLEHLVVPALCLTEVFRRMHHQLGEPAALEAVAFMERGRVAWVDAPLAVVSARLGIAHRLPLADSVILATARAFGATLWTQDADFRGIEGVKYVKARRRS